jgi:hypothetical protein
MILYFFASQYNISRVKLILFLLLTSEKILTLPTLIHAIIVKLVTQVYILFVPAAIRSRFALTSHTVSIVKSLLNVQAVCRSNGVDLPLLKFKVADVTSSLVNTLNVIFVHWLTLLFGDVSILLNVQSVSGS